MAESKKDPFKTRKTRATLKAEDQKVEAPEAIKEAIDRFRDYQDQSKHYDGEATIFKDEILEFAQGEYAKRFFNGQEKSFRVDGNEAGVTYVVMDSSAGLTDDDVESFAARWGEEAAEALIKRDFRSIRFDPKVLEANYDEVVEALQQLPEDVLENLFRPMLMMAVPGALDKAGKYAKSQEELLELMQDLKIKNYIR